MKVLTDIDLDEMEIKDEPTRVFHWRYDWLKSAKYSKPNAIKIAKDTSMDLHFAVELRERCTDEELCMRILYGSD